ncbi:MAG: response regulator [Desulfonatronovibrionaceae bacterium]
MRTNPLVLVVDDHPLNRKVLRKTLEGDGHEVLEADSGKAALALAREQVPDLIVLDIMMPGMDGFTVCSELQSDPKTSGIPVIFISAMDETESIVRGLDLGGVDYIRKPFAGAEVLARVRVHLSLKYTREVLVREQMKILEELKQTQESFLIQPEDLPRARFEYIFDPVLKAGGDFLDVVELEPGLFAYLVADVSGHSLGTAYLTSALKVVFGENLTPKQPVRQVLDMANAVLRRLLPEDQFLTVGITLINREQGSLQHFNAGHTPPVLVRSTKEAKYLHSNGDVLGAFDNIETGCLEREIQSGDRVYLYTDGLIHGRGPVWGRELLSACAAAADLPLGRDLEDIRRHMCPDPCRFEDDTIIMGTEI